MAERRRLVVLEDAVREPGEGVADDRRGDDEPPFRRQRRGDQQQNAERRAEIVNEPGARVAVGPEVVRPDPRVAADPVRHGFLNPAEACYSPAQRLSQRGVLSRRSVMGYRVAVVGATGNVGREMLTTLAERQFPV